MKVLGIYSSPRKGGNSDLVLDAVLAGASETGAEIDKVYARDYSISACIECGHCEDTGECSIEDDMQAIYQKLTESDIIILASPIFFYGIPARAKALIDRCQALWSRRMLTKSREQRKVYESGRGYTALVGATKGKNRNVGCELTARYFFDALDMSYEGGIFFTAEKKGEIESQSDELKRACDFGSMIVRSC